MAAPRRFDWDEAARLRAEGLSYTDIARRLGVTWAAIQCALEPEARARAHQIAAAWNRNGVCPECGARAYRGVRQRICRACLAKAQAKVSDGMAYCAKCDEWKPLSEFTPSQHHLARGVRSRCRACETSDRRARRQANIEATRRYDRERK